MTASERYERALPVLLEELAAPRTPDYFDDILGQVDATRQRPGWTFPERWLPMSAVSDRLATAPRVPMRAVLAAALLLIALAVGIALLAGSQGPKVPAPFGPARNGAITYADAAGDIFVGNLDDGTSRAIVGGSSRDSAPVFSPDGTKIAFLRDAKPSGVNVVVVDADGTHERVITNEPVYRIGYFNWSPDSGEVVVGIQPSDLVAFDASTASAPRPLAKVQPFDGDPWNNQVTDVFRPPDGRQTLRIGGDASGATLVVVDVADGTPTVLVDHSRTDIAYTDLSNPTWSPDGTRIAFVASATDRPGRVYVMNADGTGLRTIDDESQAAPACVSPCVGWDDANPAWSPDGTRIAVQRWLDIPGANGDNWADWVRPITVIDVATGAGREVGPGSKDGFVGWGWSPDGTSLLLVPNIDDTPGGSIVLKAGQLEVANVASGAARTLDWDVDSAGSWQRRAP